MHKEYLLSALEQAKLGRGLCAPNPSVGAIAVQHDKIIAKAWHPGAGLPHAEQILLTRMPPSCQDVTLYVTLEPCNHWGRTPPCVEAIIAHQIKRVVYAYADPNPIVSVNNSPKILAEHGIEVLHFPLPEIDRFYQSYHHWLLTHKPWVTVKIAQSLDGHIAGSQGARVSISNSVCSEFTHQQRKASDVILTTSRTILQDNPLLTARLPGQEDISKPLAVLDTRLIMVTSPMSATSVSSDSSTSSLLSSVASSLSPTASDSPLSPTFHGLTAGSRNLAGSLDPAVKPREVGGGEERVANGASQQTTAALISAVLPTASDSPLSPTSCGLTAGSRNLAGSLDSAVKPQEVGESAKGGQVSGEEEDLQSLRLAKNVLIYHDDALQAPTQQNGWVYYPMPVQNGHLDLASVISHLGSLGYHDVWVEAGSELFAALHHAGLVNRTYIYIAPKILGKSGLPLFANMESFAAEKTLSWQIMDDNVMLTIDW